MPRISVIVPVYRAEAYLRECVESILSQTFSDFEIILVDDGSPDGCAEICDEYARENAGIRVLHQTNQGQAAARNYALSIAQGEWLCFVDSDDGIHPEMLELLYRAAQESGAGISMCGMVEAEKPPEDFRDHRQGQWEVIPMDEPSLLALYESDEYPGWVACAKLIRREYVQAYPFQKGRVYEDNEAVCHWLLPAKAVARLQQKLYFYRTNPNSTTKSGFSEKRLDYLWALERIAAFYQSVGYSTLAQRFLERYLDAVENACYGVRAELDRPDIARRIMRNALWYLIRKRYKMNKKEMIRLLDAAYPQAMERFWKFVGRLKRLV